MPKGECGKATPELAADLVAGLPMTSTSDYRRLRLEEADSRVALILAHCHELRALGEEDQTRLDGKLATDLASRLAPPTETMRCSASSRQPRGVGTVAPGSPRRAGPLRDQTNRGRKVGRDVRDMAQGGKHLVPSEVVGFLNDVDSIVRSDGANDRCDIDSGSQMQGLPKRMSGSIDIPGNNSNSASSGLTQPQPPDDAAPAPEAEIRLHPRLVNAQEGPFEVPSGMPDSARPWRGGIQVRTVTYRRRGLPTGIRTVWSLAARLGGGRSFEPGRS